MKATLKEQGFRLTLKVTQARINLLRDVSPEAVEINVVFYATHWTKKEMQMLIPEGEEIEVEQEVEIATPLNAPIIVDESQRIVPYDLWVGLRKCISTPQMLPMINEALEPFNALFTDSMQGFDLEVSSIEMG